MKIKVRRSGRPRKPPGDRRQEAKRAADRARSQRNQEAWRWALTMHKLILGCTVCGYHRCAAALEFHHQIEARKAFSLAAAHNRSWASRQLECSKVVVLCSCCHKEVHYSDLGLAKERV